jgi:hypothetical protein
VRAEAAAGLVDRQAVVVFVQDVECRGHGGIVFQTMGDTPTHSKPVERDTLQLASIYCRDRYVRQ